MKEMQSSKYVTSVSAVIEDFVGTDAYVGACTSDDFDVCSWASDGSLIAADLATAGYYVLEPVISWKIDNDETPAQMFEVFYKGKNGYVYLGETTDTYFYMASGDMSNSVEGTPFYEKPLKYDASEAKVYKFAVIPVYETADFAIGATDIESKSGVATGSVDMQDLIDDLAP